MPWCGRRQKVVNIQGLIEKPYLQYIYINTLSLQAQLIACFILTLVTYAWIVIIDDDDYDLIFPETEHNESDIADLRECYPMSSFVSGGYINILSGFLL